MKIKNVKVAFLEESIIRSGYPMQVGEPEDFKYVEEFNDLGLTCKEFERAIKLAKVPSGSGHDNFLKGIIVQFDLLYTQYWTKHLQRYGWFTYFSGQSQMHKMTVRPLKEACNKYTLENVMLLVEDLIDYYNDVDTKYPFTYQEKTVYNKQQLFQMIMSNCPMGYQLWQPISTNYMSLKTMYLQRRHHKLEEWQDFCDWIETLPMSHLITGKDE